MAKEKNKSKAKPNNNYMPICHFFAVEPTNFDELFQNQFKIVQQMNVM